MRRAAPCRVGSVAATALLVALASAHEAGAAPEAGGVVAPVHTFEVDNADARPEYVLVVWPRICSASGEPLGKVDLALNPDWAARMNDVDYEVVVTGKRHEVASACRASTRVYALPSSSFGRGSRPATADDNALGQHVVGAPFVIVPLLDAVDRKRRIELFEKDPRVLRSSFRFDSELSPRTERVVTALHEVLTASGFDRRSFSVIRKSVDYTYADGTRETVTVDTSPADAGQGASEGPVSRVEAAAASAGAPGSGPADAPARRGAGGPDVGTRWVYLAAVGGLVAGGVIAFFRKKRS